MAAYLVVDTKIKMMKPTKSTSFAQNSSLRVMVASTLPVEEILPHQRMSCGHLLG